AGMLKIRVFRPFPAEEIADALKHVKAVAVMDRSDSFNAVGGPVFVDVRSALYDVDNGPKIVNYIYGIGGRDVTPDHVKTAYADLAKIAETGQVENPLTYLGIRE
ncbi:MAG: pyruvate ferredoxin oxidoreductase, partial [Bacillota bacterium]